MSEWETFCDECYYHLWRVRRKSERGFNDGYHLQHGEEAKALVELLNRLERERAEAREALADWENASAHVEANHPDEVHCGCVPVLRKLLADSRKERDEARAVAYDLATIASHCLGWHDHETGKAAERIATALKRWRGAK